MGRGIASFSSEVRAFAHRAGPRSLFYLTHYGIVMDKKVKFMIGDWAEEGGEFGWMAHGGLWDYTLGLDDWWPRLTHRRGKVPALTELKQSFVYGKLPFGLRVVANWVGGLWVFVLVGLQIIRSVFSDRCFHSPLPTRN
jgi:hypothetical protein